MSKSEDAIVRRCPSPELCFCTCVRTPLVDWDGRWSLSGFGIPISFLRCEQHRGNKGHNSSTSVETIARIGGRGQPGGCLAESCLEESCSEGGCFQEGLYATSYFDESCFAERYRLRGGCCSSATEQIDLVIGVVLVWV